VYKGQSKKSGHAAATKLRARRSAWKVRVLFWLVPVCLGLIVFKWVSGPHNFTCVKEGELVVSFDPSLSPSSKITISLSPGIAYKRVHFFENHWPKCKIAAVYARSVGDLLAELSMGHRGYQGAVISLVRDAQGVEYLVMIGKKGASSVSSVQYLCEHSPMKKGKGKSERFIEVKVPESLCESGEQILFYLQVV
jgi:hypothetical protein